MPFSNQMWFQIPIFQTRSDGRDNFIEALIMAGNYNIPEVRKTCITFTCWSLEDAAAIKG